MALFQGAHIEREASTCQFSSSRLLAFSARLPMRVLGGLRKSIDRVGIALDQVDRRRPSFHAQYRGGTPDATKWISLLPKRQPASV